MPELGVTDYVRSLDEVVRSGVTGRRPVELAHTLNVDQQPALPLLAQLPRILETATKNDLFWGWEHPLLRVCLPPLVAEAHLL